MIIFYHYSKISVFVNFQINKIPPCYNLIGDFMDQIKFGKFLSTLRNEKHLTQEQLSERLHVGSKTISKWECGNCIPDFETMIQLSKEFKVSLYELSIGERIKKKNIKKEDILKLIDKKQLKMISIKKKILLAIGTILGVILILSLIFTLTNFNSTKIYEIKSANSDFKVVGTFTKTNAYSTFTITNVIYVGNDNNFPYIEISDYYYEILYNNKMIYYFNNTKFDDEKITDNIENMLTKINMLLTSEKNNISNINKDNNISLKISYLLENERKNIITIDLKLTEKYANNKIW